MQQKKWINYWKKSLSDSLKADIDIEKLKHFEIQDFKMDSQTIASIVEVNELIDFEEERINKKKGITDKDSKSWERLETIQILIAPIKITPLPEHLIFFKDKKTKFPFWYYTKINRQGILSIPEELFPVFQRKYLEPLADERSEFIFSTVEKVDKATPFRKEKYKFFQDYITYIKDVFQKAVEQTISTFSADGYETVHRAIILLPDEDINAAAGIIQLYEKIAAETIIPPLLSDFISLDNKTENLPLPVSKLMDANFLHVGQMGYDFPLSISQRKGLYTFLQNSDRIFAVNGPPGTGKTTLLQSIVANKIVESAITGENPPLILACSTNNQAVTNIIDSFSKSSTQPGKLEGRWLPELDGYATYLPSNGKTEAELKGINYKKQNGNGLFSKVENKEYLEKATECFLQKSAVYFNASHLSIEEITQKLRSEIMDIQVSLKDASLKWKEYLNAENILATYVGDQILLEETYYSKAIIDEKIVNNDISNLMILEEKIIQYFQNESFFRKLFCSLGLQSALKNRAAEIRIILRDSLLFENKEFIKSAILDCIDKKIKIAKTISKAVTEWKSWKNKNSIQGNPPKTEEEYWKFEYLKIDGSKEGNLEKAKPNCFFDELDLTLRHKAFQLSLHYWEARWLSKIDTDLKDPNFDKKGIDAVKNRWTRQAMLTPCFVSTFYMSPKFFSAFKFLKKSEDGKNIFDNPPLFDFIDLLIVDEAGQVSPEVGAATFSLAKQAVIVGDVKQIEPVWNIINKIDVGNLKKVGLIKDYSDPIFETSFDPKGFLASTGSIMKMAQNACQYKEIGLDEKGVILVEHRRCYDEIINYCNVLAYNGQLKTAERKSEKDKSFSAYVLHTRGWKFDRCKFQQNKSL
ncbi:AAA domain-containing protein [Dyadobacter sp. 3J3]|uniref:AAA domain-containing protein n=1 Tax=Dyadobacter sp. 3J3 TaxID=2606600 RepID=UPI0013592226|nr:AAA domain-containing protein [Dyadobacter sp. 3J3]